MADFKLTYATMFNPPEELHTRFDEALGALRVKVAEDLDLIRQALGDEHLQHLAPAPPMRGLTFLRAVPLSPEPCREGDTLPTMSRFLCCLALLLILPACVLAVGNSASEGPRHGRKPASASAAASRARAPSRTGSPAIRRTMLRPSEAASMTGRTRSA